VNKKFWDGLPADIRDQLSKAMKESTAFGNGQSAKENDDALEAIRKAGKTEIDTLTPEQDARCARRWSRSTRTSPAGSASP